MRLVLILPFLLALVGCDSQIERFETNEVYALTLARSRSVEVDAIRADVADTLDMLFGSPDEPRWPESILDQPNRPLVDSQRLSRAAGPVSSEKDGTHRGSFREHCVICHALAGSGAGPASSFQDPYPRDFRHGVFKWKSTERSAKPTRDDLHRVIDQGIPGTAMPAFARLSAEDLEAIVDYLIYLAVRGEVERRLMAAAIDQLGYAETLPSDELRLSGDRSNEGGEVVREVVNKVVESWRNARQETVAAPGWEELRGPAYSVSVGRGQEIFHGPIANCVGCHGKNGRGGVATLDYDDWTKEYSTRVGLTPSDRDAMRPLREAGALTPRPLNPRKLHDAVLRGGSDAESLYRRITQGIAGTPMPAVTLVEKEDGRGLTQDQVWDLVRYVQSLAKLDQGESH